MRFIILTSVCILGLIPMQLCAQASVDTAQKVIPLKRATAKQPSNTLIHVARQNEKMTFNNQATQFTFKYVDSQMIIVDLDGDGIISDSEAKNPIPPRTTFTVKTLQGDYKFQQMSTDALVMLFSMTRLVSQKNPYHLKVSIADQNSDGRFDQHDLIKIDSTMFNAKGHMIPILGYPSKVQIAPDCSALIITPVVGDYVNVYGGINDSNWISKVYFYPLNKDTSCVTGIASLTDSALLNAKSAYAYQIYAIYQKDPRIKLYINGEVAEGWQEKVSKMVVNLNLTLEPTFVVEPGKEKRLTLVKYEVKNNSKVVNLRGLLPRMSIRQKGVERPLAKVSYG